MTIAGVDGSFTGAYGNCSSNGSQSCVASGSYFAATACSTDGSNCYLPAYALTTQPLKSIDYDNIDINRSAIRASLTISGIAGTLADCSAANAAGCVATATYKTMNLSTVSGTCLTSANFNTSIASASTFEFWTAAGARQTVAGDANLSVGNVKSGVTIHGVTGQYPSGVYTLPSASGVADLEAATFTAKVKSATAFEYWNSAGAYQTGAGDANIQAANIVSGKTIFLTDGTAPVPCTHAAQGAGLADAACRWTTACGVNPWNIRVGTTISGTAGSLKTNCRNTVNPAYYNWDGIVTNLPTTASAVVSTNYDYWDTIEDYWAFAPNRVTAWSTDTLCDSSVWSDVTTTNGGASLVTCVDGTCIYKDQISGLQVTGTLAAGGNTSSTGTPGLFAWNTAVQTCAASTYGGYAAGTWRLPTQKELMSLYTKGIVSMAGTSFMTMTNIRNYFWSASSRSYTTTGAWYVYLAVGTTYYDAKTATLFAFCVR